MPQKQHDPNVCNEREYSKGGEAVGKSKFNEGLCQKPPDLHTDMHEFDIRFKHANYLIGTYIYEETRKGRFLDIGCGTGNAVVAALTHGASLAVGVDIDFDTFNAIFEPQEFGGICAAYGAPADRALLIEADIFSTRIPYASFDYVTFIDSFEHVPEPRKFIEFAMSVLKPGGYFLLATAPLYYSKSGHHLWGEGVYPGGLPPWGHLFPGFDDTVAARGINSWHLKHHLALNRVTYTQGIVFLREVGFEIEHEAEFSVPEADLAAYERVKDKITLPEHVGREELFREQIHVRAKKPRHRAM